MKRIYQLFHLLVFCLFPLLAEASHIVGGYVSYECLEPGRYRITVNMYVNCNSQANDYFPNRAPISIYRGNTAPYTLINTYDIPLQLPTTDIPLDDNPCVILPPDICVEEGKYSFEVQLPISTESYHVSFQRCCRNASIENIINPDELGATFTVEILPAAQQFCNSSPIYTAYPPAVICVNQPISVDHSAIDKDGDLLVYSLCAPLEGAGVQGTSNGSGGNPAGCNGFRPDPACPPPYYSVPFVLPAYSALEPIPGNPKVGINSSTGQLTGIPNQQGQFAVGLCVSEYRNGELLSVVRRDFQFNITYCEETLESSMDSDEKEPLSDSYIYNSCENKNIKFINTSTIESYIDEYLWEFFVDGEVWSFSQKDLAVTFPDYGTYYGQLILNPNNLFCRDTGWIVINIFPEPKADFAFSYDTCVAGEVTFSDLTLAPGGAITSWDYDFNDGAVSDFPNPNHLFGFAGVHNVRLRVIDENGCEDEIQKPITWYPAPAIIVVEPSIFNGCAPQDVVFNNLSFPIDSTYDLQWDLGDGTSSNAISPQNTYEEVGTYSLRLGITSPLGCYIEESWDNWITVDPDPVAGFSYSPADGLTNFDPFVVFEDESVGAQFWEWYFNDKDFIYGQEASFTFRDTGLQKVLLYVQNEFGCEDTLIQYVDIAPEITYFLPNAFSPNGDGLNEFFVGKGYFRGLYDFKMTVLNRWGEVIFETQDPEQGWNGQKNNVGAHSPNGVYPVLVRYREPRGPSHQIQGFATLIR